MREGGDVREGERGGKRVCEGVLGCVRGAGGM